MVFSSRGRRRSAQYIEAVWTQYGIVFVFALVVLPPIVYDVVKVSNRFVGPVVRLLPELKRLAEGQPAPPLAFREGDCWHELAAAYNGLRARLQNSPAAGRNGKPPACSEPAVPPHRIEEDGLPHESVSAAASRRGEW